MTSLKIAFHPSAQPTKPALWSTNNFQPNFLTPVQNQVYIDFLLFFKFFLLKKSLFSFTYFLIKQQFVALSTNIANLAKTGS
jgi:hypothetical protein